MQVTGDVTRHSKRLSYVLRHNPGSVGLTLGPHGWVGIDDLLRALAEHGHPLSRATLDTVVETSGKKRFEVQGDRIRAAQGHSVPLDLGLAPQQPPATLWHGTVERFLPSIMAEGLRPRARTHVHLSPDRATARAVGARRGRPVILAVDAGDLHAAGHLFYRAANGVWLTGHVPPHALHREN